MIQMTSGAYGAREGLRRAGDGPFSLPADEEARLVNRGVARYVWAEPPDEPPAPVATPQGGAEVGGTGADTPGQDGAGLGREEGVEPAPYSTTMKADQLRALLDACGIPFRVGMTKADMVQVLDARFSGEQEDEEHPPVTAPEDPVL